MPSWWRNVASFPARSTSPPGQSIAPHPEGNEAVFYVMQGSGTMLTDEGELPIRPGSVVIVPFGGTRGMRASEDNLVVLATAVR